MKVYTDISGFQDDVNDEGQVTKTTARRSHVTSWVSSRRTSGRLTGPPTSWRRSGMLNELKLMGLPPGNQQTKPAVGGEAATDYSSTLARNACHFAPESWHAWYDFHTKARALAGEAYRLRVDAIDSRSPWADLLRGRPCRRPGEDAGPEVQGRHLRERSPAEQRLRRPLHAGLLRRRPPHQQDADHAAVRAMAGQEPRQVGRPPRQELACDAADGVHAARADRPSQHVKANVGTRTLSSGLQVETGRNPQTVENIKTNDWRRTGPRLSGSGCRPPCRTRAPRTSSSCGRRSA